MPHRDHWKLLKFAFSTPFAVLDGLGLVVLGLVLAVAAIFGPVFLEREFFGDWLAPGLVSSTVVWIGLVAWFGVAVAKGRATMADGLLLAITSICCVTVPLSLLNEARAAP
ncbi:MAG: hypothetical protein CL908_02520 [Deltaproteobacteria bacterium]|jgi:hypothetical protein|nr:hypothetical protein [Deltaproteobacteria bacterium]